ncbi:MAG TPA: GIY-YIG nuclease family protein [Bacteroidia bacterium]|jgi:putative endonuclease|nr:GIY-YIG nuclease family protein [Bacteroidia bacterium]
MYTTYALYSKEHDKIYIGFTSDLESRLRIHNEIATKGFTIKYRPWIVIYSEQYSTKAEAMKREKQLKSAQGRNFIRNLISSI